VHAYCSSVMICAHAQLTVVHLASDMRKIRLCHSYMYLHQSLCAGVQANKIVSFQIHCIKLKFKMYKINVNQVCHSDPPPICSVNRTVIV
jgi:hypothetical protein